MNRQVTIDRLGHQGDGIAEGPLYVPYTLPGEEVSGDVDGQTMRKVRILTPSSDRVRPPCRHFPACGGCLLQHGSDSFLEEWKTGIVRQALAARGLQATFLPTHISPPRSRRRAALSVKRTRKGAMVGFHAPASDIVIETPECQLLRPELIAAFPAAEALGTLGASRKQSLSVMLTLSDGGIDVAVDKGKPMEDGMWQDLAALADRHDLARLSWNGETVVTRRAPEQRFGSARVTPPPGAFLQATADGQAVLQQDVRHHLADARRIADLFAGCGTFALELAADRMVHAVEGDGAMIAALDQGWRQGEGLHGVTSEARDLFRRPLDADELRRFDAIVLDPPRAGAEAQTAEIAMSGVPRIAYVSCNPVSFARDAEILSRAGYALDRIRVVDQFRWSPHVEIVSNFSLK